jgi:hypothetical protein
LKFDNKRVVGFNQYVPLRFGMSHIGRAGHDPGLIDTLDGKQEAGMATPDLAGLVHFTIGPLAQHLKKFFLPKISFRT